MCNFTLNANKDIFIDDNFWRETLQTLNKEKKNIRVCLFKVCACYQMEFTLKGCVIGYTPIGIQV